MIGSCSFRSFEVSSTGFSNALKKHKAVVLVPGGQAEMIKSRSNQRHVVVDTTHRGFIRCAIREAATSGEKVFICPIFGFGETEVLDNISVPERCQRSSRSSSC